MQLAIMNIFFIVCIFSLHAQSVRYSCAQIFIYLDLVSIESSLWIALESCFRVSGVRLCWTWPEPVSHRPNRFDFPYEYVQLPCVDADYRSSRSQPFRMCRSRRTSGQFHLFVEYVCLRQCMQPKTKAKKKRFSSRRYRRKWILALVYCTYHCSTFTR